MNLFIPVSQSDAHLLEKLALVFNKLGPYKGHKAIVCAAEGVEQEANEFKQSVGHLFDHAAVRLTPLNITGWPIASNRHFREVAKLALNEYSDAPFWFFEPDCTPIRKGWLDHAIDFYRQSRKLYCGAVVPTAVIYRDKTRGFEGRHLVGCAIYPADLYTRSQLFLSLDRQMRGVGLPLEPFDLRMRMELEPNAANMPALQHNWRTEKYVATAQGVTCSLLKDNTHEHYAKTIEPETLVVHGCKDGSLADLVLDGTFDKAVVAPKKVVTPEPTTEPITEPDETPPDPKDYIDHRIRKYLEANPGRKIKTIASDLNLEEDLISKRLDQKDYFAKRGPGGRINIAVG